MTTKDVEEDADQELSNYRQKLVILDGELDSENIKCLKYLCFDVIPASKLEKITQGTDLFGLLEQKGALGNGNYFFLAECLSKICRLDLSEYLLDSHLLKNSIESSGSTIPPHRSLWFDISEELDSDEVCKCLYYYGDVPKSKRSGIKSGIDFLSFLEKMKKIRHDNMNYLVEVLRTIERKDLVEIIQKYKDQSSKSAPFRPIYRPPPPSAAGQEFDDTMNSLKEKENEGKEKKLIDDEDEEEKEQMSVETMVTVQPPSYTETLSQDISMPLQIQLAYEISSEPGKIPDFGKALGLSEKDIVRINANNSKRPDMKVLEMMRLQSERSEAVGENKVNELINALMQSGFGELRLKWMNHLLRINEGAVTEPNVTNPPPQTTLPELTVSETRNYNVPSHTDEHKNLYISSGEARALRPGEDGIRQVNEANADVIPPPPLLEKYRMNRSPRGICVIFNNENFTYDPCDRESKRMNNRVGSSIDRDTLVTTFNSLGFNIEAYDDLKAIEMVQILTRLSLQDHSLFDCFVCVILSHGTRDHIYGANCVPVPIRTLADPLKNLSCPGLCGKPKLFFIQACQGQDKQHGRDIERDSVPEFDLDDDAPAPGNGEVIPNEQDFLIGMATVPGFVSYRSKTHGSWYIIKLCDALQKYSKYWDILHILTYVNSEVGKANADIDGVRYKQSPGPIYTLRKRLMFDPFE